MEGDAGASRLTPNETGEDSSFPEVTAQIYCGSAVKSAPPNTADAVADDPTAEESAEDSLESEDAVDHEITESDAEDLAESATPEVTADRGGPSRLGRAGV